MFVQSSFALEPLLTTSRFVHQTVYVAEPPPVAVPSPGRLLVTVRSNETRRPSYTLLEPTSALSRISAGAKPKSALV